MVFWRYFRFYTRHTHGKLIFVVLLSLLTLSLQSFSLALIATVVDYEALSAGGGNRIARAVIGMIGSLRIGNRADDFILLLTLTAIAFTLVSMTAFWVELYVNKLSTGMGREIQSRLGEELMHAKYDYIVRQSQGHLQNVVINQTIVVADSFRRYTAIITNFFTMLAFIFGTILVNPGWVFFLMGVLTVPIFILLRGVSWNTVNHARAQTALLSRKNAAFLELIRGFSYLKSTGTAERALDRYKLLVTEFFYHMRRSNFWFAVGNHLVKAALVLIVCGIAFIRMFYDDSSLISIGLTIGFFYAVALKAVDFYRANQSFQGALGGIQAYEILARNLPRNTEGLEHHFWKMRRPDDGNFDVRDISAPPSFGKNAVPEHLSMQIPALKITIVHGPSSSGKSLLLNFMTELYRPSHGELASGAYRYTDLNITELRKSVGYVPDVPFFFRATLLENMQFRAPSMTQEQLLPYLNLFEIRAKLDALPDGLNTIIADSANNFSQTERFFLALIREIVAEPDVLLIDTPPASLDDRQAAILVRALRLTRTDMTTVMISNDPRLDSVANCVLEMPAP